MRHFPQIIGFWASDGHGNDCIHARLLARQIQQEGSHESVSMYIVIEYIR